MPANRANAQRSTGPRSTAGKAQARLNAFKHGLAIPATALPELAYDITELAERMAGPAADNPSVLQAALRVVAAAVDVDRVRWACRDLLERMLADPEFHGPPRALEPMPDRPERTRFTKAMQVEAYLAGQRELALAHITAEWAYESEVERVTRRRAHAKQKVKQRALQWDQLARLERYERRAVSQRNSAIRAFDEAVAAARNGPCL
ncbi:hypothetical protein AAII07_30695 [Microvirga sp. 0TCS3.31]